MTEMDKQILEHLKAIRDILEQSSGLQYFSMRITGNGVICTMNADWGLPKENGIAIFERGEE